VVGIVEWVASGIRIGTKLFFVVMMLGREAVLMNGLGRVVVELRLRLGVGVLMEGLGLWGIDRFTGSVGRGVHRVDAVGWGFDGAWVGGGGSGVEVSRWFFVQVILIVNGVIIIARIAI